MKAKALCWKCRFSSKFDRQFVECVNEKAHFNSPLIHKHSSIECEFFKPKRKKRRRKAN